MTAQPRKPAKATQTVWVERWCPPKPLVTLTPIDKVLNRHTFLVTPESRLVVAVITRAIGDCLSLGRGVRREARRFLLGDDLGLWCDLVGFIRTSCASSPGRPATSLMRRRIGRRCRSRCPSWPHPLIPALPPATRPCAAAPPL